MGTNYYAHITAEIPSQDYEELENLAKKHDQEGIISWIQKRQNKFEAAKIHLGKSSYGWQFIFNHNNWKYYDYTKESITRFLEATTYICDENDHIITIEDFWKLVESKKEGFTGKSYCDYEVQRAIQKEKGEIEDPYNLIMSVHNALCLKANSGAKRWYEETECKGETIPQDLGYRFSNSTDFS